MPETVVVSPAELARRTIRSTDYVSCDQAFIDCRTPGSHLKENYSIIGPGVTQNPGQVVNLREAHGFNVGAAAMPAGITNNLHLHFTAEVFVAARGEFLVRWGVDGRDGEFTLRRGDVVTVPTWIFRGFTNVGEGHGWLFTVLGFDNTGGIVWAPSVLEEARSHGLYLSSDSRLVDTRAGDELPGEGGVIEPMSRADQAELRPWTAEQIRSRVVLHEDLRWHEHAFLCSPLPGGGASLALAIGYGMTEDRDQVPPVHYPHNFSLAWLRAEPGEGLLTHRHDRAQALIVHSGRWRVVLNEPGAEVATEIGPEDTLSVPAGAWRRFEAVGDGPGELVVVNEGDGRVHLEWDREVVRLAREKGYAQDAAGYVGPWSVVRTSTIDD